jgi:hypothetical protein
VWKYTLLPAPDRGSTALTWPEHKGYKRIGPLVLFGGSVTERARETGASERTLYQRVPRFEASRTRALRAASSKGRLELQRPGPYAEGTEESACAHEIFRGQSSRGGKSFELTASRGVR